MAAVITLSLTIELVNAIVCAAPAAAVVAVIDVSQGYGLSLCVHAMVCAVPLNDFYGDHGICVGK